MYDETEKKKKKKRKGNPMLSAHGSFMATDLCEDTGGLMEGRQFVSVF